ncbi:MAG: hypothetical protein A3G18_08605 [Rhodospirillales bacterium RIFCSPLOWO2_12_FULL_58_28]|nr:MAG: hypothetical protein A3H92_00160 [Rhodospirillales bacterium RIFCSPLOWO2_02_FULL_58_16]OHC79757.1 MAG: hypothetical protein A3G18_08605 [Rhodospirillales bacterium RIFCSPLOWO2_12_FULL_58_28]
MNEIKTLAIVPVRGGSKGVPRKNLRLIGGVPLVVRAIRSGLDAKLVSQVVVSTDDDELAAISESAGAYVLRRPIELAEDDTPMMPVLNHVLDAFEAENNAVGAVVLLDATSPFRQAGHVDLCVEKLFYESAQSVITVTQLERNPFNIFSVEGDVATKFIQSPSCVFTSRREFSHLMRVNGCVYATWAKNIRAGKLIVDPVCIVEMSASESINIDTPLDLKIAEFLESIF